MMDSPSCKPRNEILIAGFIMLATVELALLAIVAAYWYFL